MWRRLLCVLTVLRAAGGASDLSKKTCSRDHWVDQTGATAFLSSHVAFHELATGAKKCGPVSTDHMQGFEALRWALSKVNLNTGVYNTQPITDRYVPGVKIGLKVHDTCSSKAAAVFGVMKDFPETGYDMAACSSNLNQIFFGILGTSKSDTSEAVSSLASQFDISQISYSATDTSLSDKTKYPTFMRTIPRNVQTAQALVELLKHLQWKYIALIHDSTSMGQESLEEIRKTALAVGICITFVQEIDGQETNLAVYDAIVKGVDMTGTTGVVYVGHGSQAKMFLESAGRLGKGNLQWILAGNEMRSPAMTKLTMAKGALFLEHHFRHIAEFETHWVSIDPNNPSAENPWFKEWWMTTYKCKLTGINYAPYNAYPNCVIPSESERRKQFVQSRHVEPAIHAVYTYANALKKARQAVCGATLGMCQNLAKLSRQQFFNTYLKPNKFTYQTAERIPSLSSHYEPPWKAPKVVEFDQNGDIKDNTFGVWNYAEDINGTFLFRSVAEYLDTRFVRDMSKPIEMYNNARTAKLPSLPASPCPSSGCSNCLSPLDNRKYYSRDGTFYLTGLFNIHKTGFTQYGCGKVNKEQAMDSQAFIYALRNVNDRTKFPGILNGVTLGGLGLDTCSSPSATNLLLSQYKAGLSTYKSPFGEHIKPFYTTNYMTDLGPLSTDTAALTIYDHRPQIHARFGSQALLDTFPYTLTTVPSDKAKAMAIVNFLTLNNWNYVQMFIDGSDRSKATGKLFSDLARDAGICVVAKYMSKGDQMDVVDHMLDMPQAQVVVSFADSDYVVKLLNAIKSKNAQSRLLIVSDSCDLDYMPDADGLVYIKLSAPTPAEFNTHLASLDVSSYSENPWFKEIYQSLKNCYLDDKHNPWGYPQKCANPSSSPITAAPSMGCGDNSLSVITAVYATAHGLHETLKHYCGVGYNGVCANFRNAADYNKVLHMKINEAMFKTAGGHNFKFINKYGNFDFDVYNFKASANKAVKVGHSDTDSNVVTLDKNQLRFFNNSATWHSQCTTSSCAVCINHALQYSFVPGDIILGGTFHIQTKGSTPFRCGPMKIETLFSSTEAVKYALSKIASGTAPVSLRGVKLGGLLLDDCEHPVRTASLIHGVHAGDFSLKHDNEMIDRSKILGWLSYSSDPTASAAKVLAYNNLPLISPSATSKSLEDIKKYPTLYRTVPSDEKQAHGMALLAKRLGFTYVLTVNTPSLYGRTGLAEFKKYAKQLGICIGASYEVETDGIEADIMKNLNKSTTRVVVVFTGWTSARRLLQAKKDIGNDDMVFIGTEDWNNNYATVQGLEDVAQNALTFRIESPPIPEFTQWMDKKTGDQYVLDPWFEEWYQLVSQCNLPNNAKYSKDCVNITYTSAVDSGRFQQGPWALSTMNAVYSFAQALDAVLKSLCGTNYNGVCDAFKQDATKGQRLVNELAKIQFTDPSNDVFKFIHREGNKGYNIFRFVNSKYEQVAKFDHVLSSLTMNNQAALQQVYKSTPSSCVGTCTQCRSTDVTEESFSYIPGDLLIAGVFDVHNTGDSPFSCGDLNTKNGFQLVEAFNFAIDQVNQRKGIFADPKILAGTTIGGIALDSCKSGTRTGTLLANIHSGQLKLKAPDGTVINPRRIETYVGALKNDVSVKMASLLNVLSIPQISYGSTSLLLSNRKLYPYFFRTVPADDKQARGFVSFLKTFELKYVQVVSSPGSYGEQAAKEFVRIAPQNGICISQSLLVERNTESAAINAVTKLGDKPDATFVVVFLESPYVSTFLKAVMKDPKARTKYRFLGSDEWGLDDDLLSNSGLAPMLYESATFDLETADLPEFDEYLRTKTPATYKRNPWWEEKYEKTFQCNMPGRSSGYNKQCDSLSKSLIDDNLNYKQDPYVLYVVNAVESAALGLHRTLVKLCGQDYSGPCSLFRNTGQRRQAVIEGIEGVKFQDATKQEFSFDRDTHESTRGYHIYSIEQGKAGQKAYYSENVGSYNDTHRLKIYSNYEMIWNSNCVKKNASDLRCEECVGLVAQPTRFMQKTAVVDLNILGFFDVHQQGSDQYNCGDMSTTFGFQNMLAFFYAIEKINMNEGLKLAQSIKLGGLAVDTCSSAVRAGNDAWTYLGGQGFCGISAKGLIDPLSVMAIVPMGSETTMAINEIARPQQITMVSPSATSPTLTDKVKYPYVLRTSPPDTLQAVAIAEFLRKYGHSYIQIMNSDDEPDNRVAETMLRTNSSTLCIANRIILPLTASLDQIKTHVQKLNDKPKATVVVVFVTTQHARAILQSIKELNLQGKFLLVGHSSWADLKEVTAGYEDVALGSITLKVRSDPIPEFIRWVAKLSFTNTKGIPKDWFEEFWQHIHKCQYRQSKFPQKQYNQLCTTNEVITEDMISMDPFVYQTIISVYEIAKGINDIPECRQSASQDVYACVKQLKDRRQKIYEQILITQWRVTFDSRNLTFKFTSDRYGDIGYYFYNYVRNPSARNTADEYGYKLIGYWQEKLDMVSDPVGYSANGDLSKISLSICPVDKKCSCKNTNNSGTTNGQTGANTQKDSLKQMQCKISPEDQAREFHNAWGIIVLAFSSIGALFCFILIIYLCAVYPVKGGTSILGFFVLVGVLLLFLLNIAFIYLPGYQVCAIRRFGQGFVYAMIFAPLLLKVLNAWRVGDDDTDKYKNLSHPMCFFFIAVFLVLVQVIINTEWLILRHPYVDEIYVNGDLRCRCSPHDFHNEGLVLSCVYVMVLILMTAIMGFVTYDNELNHREARWVLITALFTVGCWIVWTIVSTLTDHQYRDPSIAISNVVNGYIIVGCIFIRKLWLLGRYRKDLEEEKKSQYAASKRADDSREHDMYHNVYSNSAYDNVEAPNSRHSADYK